jgi:hypothetical protein
VDGIPGEVGGSGTRGEDDGLVTAVAQAFGDTADAGRDPVEVGEERLGDDGDAHRTSVRTAGEGRATAGGVSGERQVTGWWVG